MESEHDLQAIKNQWMREQCELKKKLIQEDAIEWFGKDSDNEETILLNRVGGVDISFVKGDDKHACAALVILSYPELQVVYEDYDFVHLTSPYIPQFLAFREASFLDNLITKLRKDNPALLPEVIFVDGNGILHPRGFGVASHLGVISDVCTIGVGKTLFHVDGIEKNSEHVEKINQLHKAGDFFHLVGNSGTIWGAVTRRRNQICWKDFCESGNLIKLDKAFRSTETSRNPIYVSIGHKISLETALKICKLCCKHRVPEPIRQADIRSREFLRQHYETMVKECCTERELCGSEGVTTEHWWNWCTIL